MSVIGAKWRAHLEATPCERKEPTQKLPKYNKALWMSAADAIAEQIAKKQYTTFTDEEMDNLFSGDWKDVIRWTGYPRGRERSHGTRMFKLFRAKVNRLMPTEAAKAAWDAATRPKKSYRQRVLSARP